MSHLRVFEEDLAVARSILNRDGRVTVDYLYRKCYPMFKSIYNNYFTGSTEVCEFIDEIYLLILTPSKDTGRCQLENYRGESTLVTWLKSACLFHCYHRYQHKKRIPTVELVVQKDDETGDATDRFLKKTHSTTMDLSSMARNDLDVIIGMMTNERYRNIIRLRYLERKSNEETAETLGMSMTNYYNKHKLAKEQFVSALRKEFDDV